jgi:hypothetical protein
MNDRLCWCNHQLMWCVLGFEALYATDFSTVDLPVYIIVCFFLALRLNAGHGLLILEISRSHTTTQSVGLLWTSDQLVAETSI